jgi:hypothetical protein
MAGNAQTTSINQTTQCIYDKISIRNLKSILIEKQTCLTGCKKYSIQSQAIPLSYQTKRKKDKVTMAAHRRLFLRAQLPQKTPVDLVHQTALPQEMVVVVVVEMAEAEAENEADAKHRSDNTYPAKSFNCSNH